MLDCAAREGRVGVSTLQPKAAAELRQDLGSREALLWLLGSVLGPGPHRALSPFLYLHPRSCLLWRMAFADWSSSPLLGGSPEAAQARLDLGVFRLGWGPFSLDEAPEPLQLTSVDTVLHLQHLSPPEVCCVVLSAPSFFPP